MDKTSTQFSRDLTEWLSFVAKLRSSGVALVEFRDYKLRESLAKRAETRECALILKASISKNPESIRVAWTSERLRRFAKQIGEEDKSSIINAEGAKRWIHILDLYASQQTDGAKRDANPSK